MRKILFPQANGLTHTSLGQRPGGEDSENLLALKGRTNAAGHRLGRSYRALDIVTHAYPGVALGWYGPHRWCWGNPNP